tara:strand:+ start:380 stop:1234 length:855 start_codon:yes stop_codon:yes gene_type:complete
MVWMAAAVLGSSIIGGVVQSKAAKTAAAAQTEAAEMGIDAQLASTAMSVAEQQRQFDAAKALLQPYVDVGEPALAALSPYADAGPGALQGQLALAGLSGVEAQREAIGAIEQGGEYQSLVGAGEEAILQSAAATGGLRGGNVQGALAQFRPQVLSSLINQQYSRLGGLTNMGLTTQQNLATIGQNAAVGVGTAGLQTGSNISNLYGTSAANVGNLYGQQGAAAAGSALAQGQAWGNAFGNIGQYAGGVSSGIYPNMFGSSQNISASKSPFSQGAMRPSNFIPPA